MERLLNLKKLLDISFDGYAIGGLAVGESQIEMFETLDCLKKFKSWKQNEKRNKSKTRKKRKERPRDKTKIKQ